jgi:hypothetical protein
MSHDHLDLNTPYQQSETVAAYETKNNRTVHNLFKSLNTFFTVNGYTYITINTCRSLIAEIKNIYITYGRWVDLININNTNHKLTFGLPYTSSFYLTALTAYGRPRNWTLTFQFNPLTVAHLAGTRLRNVVGTATVMTGIDGDNDGIYFLRYFQ